MRPYEQGYQMQLAQEQSRGLGLAEQEKTQREMALEQMRGQQQLGQIGLRGMWDVEAAKAREGAAPGLTAEQSTALGSTLQALQGEGGYNLARNLFGLSADVPDEQVQPYIQEYLSRAYGAYTGIDPRQTAQQFRQPEYAQPTVLGSAADTMKGWFR
jgi:hypothetical protein